MNAYILFSVTAEWDPAREKVKIVLDYPEAVEDSPVEDIAHLVRDRVEAMLWAVNG